MSKIEFQYRGKIEIIHSILENTQTHWKTLTSIMYENKMSHSQVKQYVAVLVSKELLVEDIRKDKKMYAVTVKGQEYLSASRRLMSLLA